MFIPNTISSNTLAVYHSRNKIETKRLLKSEDFIEWKQQKVITLRQICLNIIVLHWTERPLINEFLLDEDARYVLDHLSIDIDYRLAVCYIHDEIYWRRAFRTRWPTKMPPAKPAAMDYDIPNQFNRQLTTTGSIIKLNTWKCFYIERHLQDFLECLKPEQYNPTEMKQLIELSKDYVMRLKLNQLQAPARCEKDRIPLNAILPALPYLKELIICYKQTYVGDDFSWHVLQTTAKDIEMLSAGLKCCNLKVLRIINTDITCAKVTTIARNLQFNQQLTIVDLSHCKIDDTGALAVCRLLVETPTLNELNLMNNLIGMEIIAFTLIKPMVCLQRLDLSLNACADDDGARYASTMLAQNRKLRVLKLAACGLTERGVRMLIEALAVNATLWKCDLSNNKFTVEIGKLFSDLFAHRNHTLRTLDLRMTTIPAGIIADVEDVLRKNRTRVGDNDDEKLREKKSGDPDAANDDERHIELDARLEHVFDCFLITREEEEEEEDDEEEEEHNKDDVEDENEKDIN